MRHTIRISAMTYQNQFYGSSGSMGRRIRIYQTCLQDLWDILLGSVKQFIRIYYSSSGSMERRIRIRLTAGNVRPGSVRQLIRICEMTQQDQWDDSSESMVWIMRIYQRLSGSIRQVSRKCEMASQDQWNDLSGSMIRLLQDILYRLAGSVKRRVRIYEMAGSVPHQELSDMSGCVRRFIRIWKLLLVGPITICLTGQQDLWDGLSESLRRFVSICDTCQHDMWDGSLGSMSYVRTFCGWVRKDLIRIFEMSAGSLRGHPDLWDRSAESVRRFVRIYETAYQHLLDRSAGSVRRFVWICNPAYPHLWDRSKDLSDGL